MAKQTILLPALAALCLAGNAAAQGFGKAGEPVIRSEYRPKGDMYRDGWIDFNKNGKKTFSKTRHNRWTNASKTCSRR